MLVVEGLSVSYGPVQALQDVSLTVPPGQVIVPAVDELKLSMALPALPTS